MADDHRKAPDSRHQSKSFKLMSSKLVMDYCKMIKLFRNINKSKGFAFFPYLGRWEMRVEGDIE